MDIEGFEIAFATVGILALAIGIFAAFRTKSIGCGAVAFFYLFLFFVLVFGGLWGMSWLIYAYGHYVSELAQIRIDFVVSMIGCLMMIGVSLVWGRRSKKAGNVVVNGQTKNAYLAQGAGMLLYVYIILASFIHTTSHLINTVPQPYSDGNTFWWIVLICFALYWYYSTEWRGSGFVYRGKVIPFTDVVHARWESPWPKIKLKIKLKNNDQELAFTVPEEMVPAIDKYLQAFFPNP